MINRFVGEYRFLSNFYPAEVYLDRQPVRLFPKDEVIKYPTVEHAYQASKTTDSNIRDIIRLAITPGIAKRYGSTVILRAHWDEIKLIVMENLIRQKFQNPTLASKLISTSGEELVEGNTWGDTFWGVCEGKGENRLGKILMKVRAEIQRA